MEKTKPAIKVYGFEDIEPIESITSITAKRQIMDRLRVNLVVFNDRIEIRCQIPIEPDKSTNVILNLGLPSGDKTRRRGKSTIINGSIFLLLQEVLELFNTQTCIVYDSSHRISIDGISSGNA